MARKKATFTPEFREEAARLVVENDRRIADVAREIGVGETTLGNWVKKYREDHVGDEPPLGLSERAELAELRRRTRDQEMELAFLKKAGRVLREGAAVSEKYEFIAAEYAHNSADNVNDAPSLKQMFTWLGVSRSGYYDWRDRPPSATTRRREELKLKIEALFDHNDRTYGYRRIHAELLRGGEQAGPELVRDLMRELGLVPCQPRPYKITTIQGDDRPATPDLVRRDFTADAPGTKLVGDITYIHTWEGWLYLATVIDCFNKEVIGYALADHMRTELVTDALDMAARNHDLADRCILHSDRGTQYTSTDFSAKIKQLGMRASLGRTGICYDNALAESFNSMLKVERVYRTVYPTRKKAREDVANYIELFYNRRRIHSGLGYRTPHEVRNEHLNGQLAA
ncbi:IS3 family transposase [Jiangella alkaliphila]|uniref:IS3 family transposase n=1 Tax=Jiangella alkaliphila TaxID=419479 RepID=UPI0038B2B418